MPENAAPEGTPEAPTGETGGTLDNLPEGFEWVRDHVAKIRDEAAKYRTRAREFADDSAYEAAKNAVAKLREIEDAEKTEVQRANEAREAAEKLAKESATQLARVKAVARHGLSEDALEFLSGETEEEIEERAKRLAEMTKAKPRGDRRPDPSQGSTAGGGSSASTADQFAEVLDSWLS